VWSINLVAAVKERSGLPRIDIVSDAVDGGVQDANVLLLDDEGPVDLVAQLVGVSTQAFKKHPNAYVSDTAAVLSRCEGPLLPATSLDRQERTKLLAAERHTSLTVPRKLEKLLGRHLDSLDSNVLVHPSVPPQIVEQEGLTVDADGICGYPDGASV
jgi:hypothetical protein